MKEILGYKIVVLNPFKYRKHPYQIHAHVDRPAQADLDSHDLPTLGENNFSDVTRNVTSETPLSVRRDHVEIE